MTASHISICICTFKRPDSLKRTLENMRALATDGLFDYSIVVVDNDENESARKTVSEFAQTTPLEVTYGVEPEQNISRARNKALQLAKGDFVAWIDDDEFPARDWLVNFFMTLEKTRAAGALGPVEPVFDNPPPSWIVKGKFFEKRRSMATGTKLKWYQTSTSNVLIRQEILNDVAEPFRPQFGAGCEDVDFFKRMMERGHTFLGCHEAVVYEVIPPARWRRRYLLRRALLRGQNNRYFADARSVMKSLVALPLYLLLLPFLLPVQHRFVIFLMKIGDHAGKLLGVAGFNCMGNKYLAESPGNT